MWVSPFRIRRARRSVGRAHSVEGLEPRVLLSLVRVGPEVHPGSLSAGTHEAPAVAVGPEGNFVVAWWIERPNNQGDEVDAQRYDAAGTPLGGPFLVSLGSNGRYPAVAMDKGGNFVVTWDDAGSIYARLYDASGTPRANPFFVSPKLKYLTFQQHSAVAMDPDGDFVVSWREEDFSQGGAYTLYARPNTPADVPPAGNSAASLAGPTPRP